MFRKLIGACVGLAIAALVIGAPRAASALLMDASYSITFAGANPVTGSGTFDVVGGSIIDFTATINTVPWVPAAPLINVDSGVVGSIEPVGEPAFPDSFMELASDGTWAMGPGFNDCVLCDPTIQAGRPGLTPWPQSPNPRPSPSSPRA